MARIIFRLRQRTPRFLSPSDDIIILTASACALGSTLLVSIAVKSGLGKRRCLLDSTKFDQIQIEIFAANILFILATSIAKCSLLLFLHRLADRKLQRACAVTISSLVLLETIAVISGTVFQCESPRPWTIWTGRCISLVSLRTYTHDF